jgi:hypothetical protein
LQASSPGSPWPEGGGGHVDFSNGTAISLFVKLSSMKVTPAEDDLYGNFEKIFSFCKTLIGTLQIIKIPYVP